MILATNGIPILGRQRRYIQLSFWVTLLEGESEAAGVAAILGGLSMTEALNGRVVNRQMERVPADQVQAFHMAGGK